MRARRLFSIALAGILLLAVGSVPPTPFATGAALSALPVAHAAPPAQEESTIVQVTHANYNTYYLYPLISGNGRKVAF